MSGRSEQGSRAGRQHLMESLCRLGQSQSNLSCHYSTSRGALVSASGLPSEAAHSCVFRSTLRNSLKEPTLLIKWVLHGRGQMGSLMAGEELEDLPLPCQTEGRSWTPGGRVSSWALGESKGNNAGGLSSLGFSLPNCRIRRLG